MRLGRDLIVCSCFVVSLLSFTCTVHGLSGSPLEPPGSSRTLALGRHHQWPSMLNFLSCQVHGRLIPSAGNKAVCHHTLLRKPFLRLFTISLLTSLFLCLDSHLCPSFKLSFVLYKHMALPTRTLHKTRSSLVKQVCTFFFFQN